MKKSAFVLVTVGLGLLCAACILFQIGFARQMGEKTVDDYLADL